MTDNKTSILLTADDRTRAAFESAKRGLAGLETSARSINGVLAGLGAGVSAGALTAFVKGTIDSADAMNDMAIRTGTSVEALARYQLAAKQSGTDLERLSQFMGRLSVFMAKNADEAARLGITAKDPTEAFAQLADVIGQVEDPAQRNALAMKVLGKGYAEVMPLLAQGGDALREQAEAAGPYAKNMATLAKSADEFNDALAGIGQGAQTALLPLVQSLTDTMNAAIAATEGLEGMDAALTSIGQFGAVGQTVAVTWANVAYVFKQVGTEIGGIAAQLAAIARADFKGAGFIGATMKADAKAARAELDALEKRIMQGPGQSLTKIGAKARDLQKIKLPNLGGGGAKAKSDKLDTIDPFGKQRSAAEADALRKIVDQQNAAYDALAATRDDQIAQDERAAASLGRARDAMLDILDPIQRYRDELAKVDDLVDAGLFTPEQAAAARLYWNEQMDAAAGFGQVLREDVEKSNDIAKELGMTFSSAFEDAIVGGEEFRDVLDSIAQDITRIFIRKNVTEPIAGGLSDIFKSFDLGSIFGGGKAVGGPVSSGRAYLVGERGPELFVPPASGNIVPNNQLGGGRSVVINMNVSAQDAGSFRRSMGQIKADLAFAVSSAGRNM